MVSFHDCRILPHPPHHLFDLVMDIESYPLFLPWCKDARIVSRQDGHIVADLRVGFSLLDEWFRSRVSFDRPESIHTTCSRGSLTHLNSTWRFTPWDQGKTQVNFDMTFDFQSVITRRLMESVFEKAAAHMIKAFESRAIILYCKK